MGIVIIDIKVLKTNANDAFWGWTFKREATTTVFSVIETIENINMTLYKSGEKKCNTVELIHIIKRVQRGKFYNFNETLVNIVVPLCYNKKTTVLS